jgi:hypothetical protein
MINQWRNTKLSNRKISIESSKIRGTESIDVQRQVPPPSYDSVSQRYNLMLQKLKNHVTNPDGGSRSPGRLQEVGIVNYVDYET